MGRYTTFLRICALTVVSIGILSSWGCNEAPKAAFICRIAAVEGTVTIHRAGTAQEVAQKGLTLAAGDKVATDAKSSIKLKFKDFATVVLGEKTEYLVKSQTEEKGRGIVETSSELLKGVGLVKVDPKKKTGFTIKTPHVITGVLGTEFGLEVTEPSEDALGDEGQGTTLLAVISGLVSFEGGGGAIEVGPGFGARCNGFMPPGLIKKFTDMDTKMDEFLQGFIRTEAAGSTDLKTIFRFY